jgi:hypothetical protein
MGKAPIPLYKYVICPIEKHTCGCQKFQHRIGHVPIREKGEYGPDLCVGDVEPKTLLQVR